MRKGFPRPALDSMPLPYSGDKERHGVLDTGRAAQCNNFKLCGVCGVGLEDEYFCLIDDHPRRGELPGQKVDNLWLHKKCLALCTYWCPDIKRALGAGQYRIVVTTIRK